MPRPALYLVPKPKRSRPEACGTDTTCCRPLALAPCQADREAYRAAIKKCPGTGWFQRYTCASRNAHADPGCYWTTKVNRERQLRQQRGIKVRGVCRG